MGLREGHSDTEEQGSSWGNLVAAGMGSNPIFSTRGSTSRKQGPVSRGRPGRRDTVLGSIDSFCPERDDAGKRGL